jgi:glycosyltransferase involved in cell wall biosynthesis
LPIITTRGTVVEPPFVDGENVLACPSQDSESMARAMLRVIEDVDLRGRLRAGSLKLAREWYSLDRAVERIAETLVPTAQAPAPGELAHRVYR